MNKRKLTLALMAALLVALSVFSLVPAAEWETATIEPIGSERMEGTLSKGIQPNQKIIDGLGAITEKDWSLGPEDAAMTILMYSDFECPHCSNAGLAMLKFQAEHPDDVRYVYRHFPLPYHTKAPAAAWAANAAGKQDPKYFFTIEHYLYENQQAWAQFATIEEFEPWLKDYVATIEGLDFAQWEIDYQDDAMRTQLEVDFDKAATSDFIGGTPTVFLNMNAYKGGWDQKVLSDYLAYFMLQKRAYTELPPIVIDPAKEYRAIIETSKGDIIVELFADESPLAVNNFVYLASEGWYDGNPFYRVKDGFIAETGDPAGNGMGATGYLFANDVNDLSYGEAGLVGMVNGGKDKNGSKFFFSNDLKTYFETTINALNDQTKEENKLSADEIANEVNRELTKMTDTYPIFGKVVEGLELIPTLTTEDAIVTITIESKNK